MTFKEAVKKAMELDSYAFRVYNDEINVQFYHGMVYFDGVEKGWDDSVEIPLQWVLKDNYKLETGIEL